MSEINSSLFKKLLIGSLALSIVLGGITGGLVGLYTAASITGKQVSVPQIIKNVVENHNTGLEEDKKEVVSSVPKVIKVDESTELSEMVKKVSPSVVSIIVSKEVSTQVNPYFFDLSPFGFDFGNPSEGSNGNTNSPKEKRQVGSGSGFIISADGLIVTNRHVVSDTTATYSVALSDGTKHDAKVLARDTVIDLALIKIEGKNLPALTLGDSDSLVLGQTVVAIGNALGEFSNSVTRGIVSGLNRKIVASGGVSGSETIDAAIQTDAAINPGNSGGPLLTLDGKVVGVNTAVSQQGQSVGFSIPINVAKQSINSVLKTGRIVRPYLGIRYVLLSEEMAKQNQLPVKYGALVSRGASAGQVAVIPGSPADKAGIVENDIILEADGTKIDTEHPITSVIIKKMVGDKISLKVYHKGDTKTINVVLSEMPQQ